MTAPYGRVNRGHKDDPGARRGRVPMGHATLDLVEQARSCVAEAAEAQDANERFAAAHLAALRAAAAVLAARAQPAGRRTGSRAPRRRGHGPRNVWDMLPTVAPELGEWAQFFATTAGKRAAAQAGLRGAVSAREADDLVRDADTFVAMVCLILGLPYRIPAGEQGPDLAAPLRLT